MHSVLSQHPMPRAACPRGTADAEFRHDLLRTGRLPVQRRGDHRHSRVRFSSVAGSVQFNGGFRSVQWRFQFSAGLSSVQCWAQGSSVPGLVQFTSGFISVQCRIQFNSVADSLQFNSVFSSLQWWVQFSSVAVSIQFSGGFSSVQWLLQFSSVAGSVQFSGGFMSVQWRIQFSSVKRIPLYAKYPSRKEDEAEDEEKAFLSVAKRLTPATAEKLYKHDGLFSVVRTV